MAELYLPRAYVLRISASMRHRQRGSRREIIMAGDYLMGKFVSFADLAKWQADFKRIERRYGIVSTLTPCAVWPTEHVIIDLDAADDNDSDDCSPDGIADQLSVLIPENYLREEARRQAELVEGIYGPI